MKYLFIVTAHNQALKKKSSLKVHVDRKLMSFIGSTLISSAIKWQLLIVLSETIVSFRVRCTPFINRERDRKSVTPRGDKELL